MSAQEQPFASPEQAQERFMRFLSNVSESGQIRENQQTIDLLRRMVKPVEVSSVDSRSHYARAKRARQNKIINRQNQMLNDRLNIVNKYNYDYQNKIRKQKRLNELRPIS